MSDVYLVWSDKSKHSTDSKTDLLIFKAQNQTLPNIYAKLTSREPHGLSGTQVRPLHIDTLACSH